MNVTGGLRSLDVWLDSGTGDPLLIDRLTSVYRLDPVAVRATTVEPEAQLAREYEDARRRREQWERQNFRQYAFVETPAGVVAAASR